jgi:hypothetical protein
MKKTAVVIMLAAISTAASALAEVNVDVHIGVPPPPRVIVAAPPEIRFDAPPLFVAPSRLGFYVGVDTPYDIVFSSNFYYLYYGNGWHRSAFYNGPWVGVPYRELPPAIRKHRIEQIRTYRDREFRVYRNDREHYRGQHFRPSHERKEEIREERRHDRQEFKEERRRDKEEFKEERRRDKEDRFEEKHDRGRHGRD